jgi:hypothetical protein
VGVISSVEASFYVWTIGTISAIVAGISLEGVHIDISYEAVYLRYPPDPCRFKSPQWATETRRCSHCYRILFRALNNAVAGK